MFVGGMMFVFRYMFKVFNVGSFFRGSFGYIGIIEIGIC